VEAIRRNGDALGARNLHSFESRGKRVFKNGALVGRKFSQNVAHHLPGLAATDADFQARERIIAEVLEDGFDAVVTTGRAFFAKA